MPQASIGIFGAIAVALTFGVVQFASGRDLSGGLQASLGASQSVVNRTAKADRAAGVARSRLQTRTISFQLNGIPNTSVVVRVPGVQVARNGSYAPSLMRSGVRKMTVACEPVVSVLTEVAKQLQPGRCVT